VIGASSVDLNPIDAIAFIVSVLRYPIGWLIKELSGIFNAVGPLQWIGAFGLSIIVVTLLIRGLLFPVFRWNIRTQRRVQRDQRRLSPEINEMRRRYKGNNQKIYEEQRRIYAEHGVSMFSPMSGCLPLLVQLPVLYGLYWGIRDVIGLDATKTSSPRVTFDLLPASISHHFLWIHDVGLTIGNEIQGCSATAVNCHTNWANLVVHPANLALLILPLLTGLTYFVQSKMTMQPLRADMSDTERQMASSMRTVVYFMPLMSMFFCFIWPQGLTLYWLTAAMVMVGQQFGLMGWGSLRVPPWFPGAHRVTELSYRPEDFGTVATATGASSNGQGAKRKVGAAAAPPAAPGRGRAPARSQKRTRRRR
jgi:YidC/Oxa1 family membrane protein insertase